MTKLKNSLTLIAEGSILSLIIVFIDFIIFFIFASESPTLTSDLSLVALLEGGLCLVLGGGAVFYTPSFSKLNQLFFRSEPWDAAKQKNIENQMQVVITLGFILVIEGLIISLL